MDPILIAMGALNLTTRLIDILSKPDPNPADIAALKGDALTFQDQVKAANLRAGKPANAPVLFAPDSL
jgi:hypothetical protein